MIAKEAICFECKHLLDCPIIAKWVEVNYPSVVFAFSCSEYSQELTA